MTKLFLQLPRLLAPSGEHGRLIKVGLEGPDSSPIVIRYCQCRLAHFLILVLDVVEKVVDGGFDLFVLGFVASVERELFQVRGRFGDGPQL